MKRKMKTQLLTLGFLGILAVSASANADGERHPMIHHARHKLEEAKKHLEKAPHDFGGHRTAAIQHIDQAIQELDQALQYAQQHPEENKK